MALLHTLPQPPATGLSDLDALTRHLPVPVVRLDLDGRHLYVNDAATRTSGVPRAKMLGATLRDLDAPPCMHAAFARLLDGARRGEPATAQVPHPHHGPAERILELRGQPELGPVGEPVGLLITVHPRPLSPEAWRLLAHHVPSGGAFLFDDEGVVVAAGGECIDELAGGPERFVGQTLSGWPEPCVFALRPALKQALAGERATVDLTLDGRVWEGRLAPIRSGDTITHVVMVTREVTADRERLREAHHRVKNHLALACSLLRIEAGRLAPEAAAVLGRSEERIRSFATLYDRLARAPSSESVAAASWLRGVLDPWQRLLGERLHADVGPGRIGGETALPLGLVLNELVSNATEHAVLPFGARLDVQLHRTRDDAGWLLVVADDGPGLPPGSRTPPAGNLGTSLVQLFARKLGATMDWDGSRGTTVTVQVPDPA